LYAKIEKFFIAQIVTKSPRINYKKQKHIKVQRGKNRWSPKTKFSKCFLCICAVTRHNSANNSLQLRTKLRPGGCECLSQKLVSIIERQMSTAENLQINYESKVKNGIPNVPNNLCMKGVICLH